MPSSFRPERGHRRQLGIAFQHEVAEEAPPRPRSGAWLEQLCRGPAGRVRGRSRRECRRPRGWCCPTGGAVRCRGTARRSVPPGIFSSRRAAPMHHFFACSGGRRTTPTRWSGGSPGRRGISVPDPAAPPPAAWPPRAGWCPHQQRDQDDEEGHVEEQLGVLQAGHQQHREDDRHRAAQADPGDEGFRGRGRRGTGSVRSVPTAVVPQDHPQRQGQCRQGDRPQVVGVTSRPRTRNMPICAAPGHAVEPSMMPWRLRIGRLPSRPHR